MKRKITVFFTMLTVAVTLVFAAFSFTACNEKKDVEPVVIYMETTPVSRGQSLLDVMTTLEEDGELSFTEENGMIVKLNGTKNEGSSYWMLYTSDAEYANTAWGTYEYEGQTYGSATLGATELPFKVKETYIWVYQSF